jgi:hypothetical protein
MQVGDIVAPSQDSIDKGKILCCGTGRYSDVVVARLKPFTLVSASCDMVWSVTWAPQDLVVVGKANPVLLARVHEKLHSDADAERALLYAQVEKQQ